MSDDGKRKKGGGRNLAKVTIGNQENSVWMGETRVKIRKEGYVEYRKEVKREERKREQEVKWVGD